MKFSSLLSSVVVFTALGCGSQSVKTSSAIDSTQKASTNNGTESTDLAAAATHCVVQSGALKACVNYATAAAAQEGCAALQGTVSTTACDTATASGTCDVEGAMHYYYEMSADAMSAACASAKGFLSAAGNDNPTKDVTCDACTGIVDPCSKMTNAGTCGAQKGCAWFASVCEGEIANTSYNCDVWSGSIDNDYLCMSAPGCKWEYANGFGICRENTPLPCKQMNEQQCKTAMNSRDNRFSCRWAPPSGECRGWAAGCETFSDTTACGAQSGCRWK